MFERHIDTDDKEVIAALLTWSETLPTRVRNRK
nr:hypothetical protein [Alicyclobacillus contaminans]